MGVFPENVVKAAKKSTLPYGKINESVRHLLSLMDIQNQNLFEMILTPQYPLEEIKAEAKMAGLKAKLLPVADSLLTKLYVQSIEIPMFALEYTRVDANNILTDLNFPEDIVITFIEDELSTVRNFLNYWSKQICVAKKENISLKKIEPSGGWVFKDNQLAAYKKAIIIPQMKTGLPSAAWIQIEGLRFKSMDPFTFDQAEGIGMRIRVNCACDNAFLMTPLSPS